jgi:hypothetical protein
MWQGFKTITYWNRKLHIYTGLFLLWFIWLFSVSGLLLNHGKWKFAGFWDQRRQSVRSLAVNIPEGLDSVALIRLVMKETNISGEVSDVLVSTDSINFKVSIPGHERNLHVDVKRGTCTMKETVFNLWGKIRTLHTFNGVDKKFPDKKPDWILTRIWHFSMNMIATGLIILCTSSWIMWINSKKYFLLGGIILASGIATTIFLVFIIKLF